MPLIEKLLAVKHERLDSKIVADIIVSQFTRYCTNWIMRQKYLYIIFYKYIYGENYTEYIGFITNYKIIALLQISQEGIHLEAYEYRDGLLKTLKRVISNNKKENKCAINTVCRDIDLTPYEGELTFGSFLPRMTKSAR
jgi:hypothetical protein